jgi:hypothetical protein
MTLQLALAGFAEYVLHLTRLNPDILYLHQVCRFFRFYPCYTGIQFVNDMIVRIKGLMAPGHSFLHIIFFLSYDKA